MATAFIKPNTKRAHYGKVAALSAVEPPVWLTLFSQTVPDGAVVDMEAEDLDGAGLIERLRAMDARRAVILATGTHPSAHVQQGEAAAALRSLIERELKLPVEVYDHLPFDPLSTGAIDWGRLPLARYRAHNWHSWGRPDRSYGATFASISCPYTCDFCCVKDFYRSGYRQRSPELVLKDVTALHQRGVTNIKLMDELFVLDNAGVRATGDILTASGLAAELNIWAYARIDTVNPQLLKRLRAAGVRWLAYGIESGNEAIRAASDKGSFTNALIRDAVAMTKDAGIHVVGNFMFGFWEDTAATMRETLALAKDLRCEYANFYCLSVYPGSTLYDGMRARGVDLPRTGEEFAQMSPRFKPVPTRTLSGREVLAFRDGAFLDYFTDERCLGMMGRTFGASTVDEIRAMTAIDIRSTP